MSKFILFSLLMFFGYFLNAQGNAASFDGTTGYISVEQAAAFTPDEGITIEAWVYPRNEAPGWPDFDGLFGIRNETDCDFYLLQLNATDIEARFRNSDGTNFTINNGGLVINEWNHLALTYGENFLTYYLNGEFQQVISAEGVCGDMTLPFTMGKLNFDGTNDFYFDGMLDEVRVWFEARTEDQIESFYNCKINNPEEFPTLGFFYNLDETDGATSVFDGGDTGINGEVIEGVTFAESTVDYKVVNQVINEYDHSLLIYPNPSNGKVSIAFNNLDIRELHLINNLGQKKILDPKLIQAGKLELIHLDAGIYQLQYFGNYYTGTQQFVVIN